MVAVLFLFMAGLAMMFSGSSDGLIMGLLLSGICAIILWRPFARDKYIDTMVNEKHITISDQKNGYIVLNKRTENNGKVLKVEAFRDYTMTDHPAELVYTSATVGGVTTGGFHVNEAYRTESIGGKTGAYYVSLRGYNKSTTVKKVYLQPDMVNSAKSNPILKTFLNGTTLILRHNVQVNIPESVRKAAMEYNKVGRYDMAAKLLRPYNSVCELTKEECEAVVSWMSDERGD